jgi:inner membrane protein
MPTILTHALLPLIAAAGTGLKLPRLIAAGMAVAMLPDADVVGGMFFSIPHTDDFGHRGASHTFLFALIVGLVGARYGSALRAAPRLAFLFLFLSTLSHAVADMLTDGGKGIMLLWPLEESRYTFLHNPVVASPVGLRGFETGQIWAVLLSEAVWLLTPAALLAFLGRVAAKTHLRSTASD